MADKKPETTLEALAQLNKALEELARAIDYEIHILRTLETISKRLGELTEAKK